MRHFTSFEKIWKAGIARFRDILNNEPPQTLIGVLEFLLVAASMSATIHSEKESLHVQ
jgi:hypothetical protein